MNHNPSATHRPGIWRRFLAIKTLLISFSLVSLLATNVASVVNASVHDWMHNALWRVLSIGGGASVADRVMANSPKTKLDQDVKVKTADLDAKNKQLTATNALQAKELESAHVKNLKLAQQLDENGKQAKATATVVHKRLAKGVSRNLAALPSESIPYMGMGVTLAVTSLDIYDACQTMKDFNALLRMMGQGEENPDLCGQRVPTVDQVLTSTKAEWQASVQRVAEESKAFKVTVPEVRLPTRDEVTKATCAVVSFPYLCP